MVEISVSDIIERLGDLNVYSPGLAARRPDETHLPENPAGWLCMKLEHAFANVENSEHYGREDAFRELEEWLVVSSRYYLSRLAEADNPWCFTFPKRPQCTHKAVFTQQ